LGTPTELLDHVGQRLGTSPWITVTQPDVDDFARITRDEQWIHVDQDRAAVGPFGTTIAHGFFVLSLCAHFIDKTLRIEDFAMGINYGLDRVRFISPVPIGSRLRASVDVASAEPIDGGVRYTLSLAIELEGNEKPACIATVVALAYSG
jgi:acyl dehydratase